MATEESERRVQTTCLLVLTFIASGAALYFVRSVVVPFVLAGFFVILLKPFIDWQTRHLKLPAGLAFATTLLLGASVLTFTGGVIASSVADLADKQDEYIERLGELEDKVSASLQRMGFDTESKIEKVLDRLPQLGGTLLTRAINGLVGVASQGVLVLIFMGFLLAGMTSEPAGTWKRVHEGVTKYLHAKVAMSVLTAVLVYVILVLCNVPLALLWALFTFLLNFVPNIGSIVANLLPIPVILLSPEVQAPWIAILVPIAVQFVVGNVVEPKVMGKSVGLHPVTILMALIFWGLLWGFIGMLLSVPLTLTLRILLEQSEFTRPLADAMAGRLGPSSSPETEPTPVEG